MSRSQRSSSISHADDENDNGSQHEMASVDLNDALQLAMALAMAEGDENENENDDDDDDDGIQVLDMDEKDYEEEEDGKEEEKAEAEAASIEASIDPSSERAQRRRRRQQQTSMEGVEERSTRRRTTSEEEAMQARLLSLIRRVAATRGHMGSRLSRMIGEDDADTPVEQKVEVLTREEDTSALDEFAHSIQRHTTKGTKNIWSHLPIASTTYHQGSSPHKPAPSKGQHGSILGRYVPNTTTWTEEYQQRAFCGKFSQSGEVFCSASQDGVIHLYDDDFRPIKQIEARDVGWAVVDVDFSADERWVIYSSWSDYVHLCNVHGEYNLHEGLNFAPLGQVCMFGVRFAPNNQDILAGLNHGHIILYDVERKQRLLYARGHDDDINSVCYVDDSSNLFATGSDDATCHIWDKRMLGSSAEGERPQDAIPIGGFIGHQHGLTCVASRMDGRYILTNSKDQSMKLWDLRKLASPSELAQHRRHRLASERTIDYRWHRYRRDGTRNQHDHSLMTYLSHTIHQTLVRCDFSPLASTGHRYVYTGSSDSNVYIYDAITGRVVNRLEGHTSIVRDVSWHPYKSMLISSSWDATSRRFEYMGSDDGEGDGDDGSSSSSSSRRSALSRRQQHQAAAHAAAQEQARERARRAAEAATERRRAYRQQVWIGSHQHGHEESHQRTRQHDDDEEQEQEQEEEEVDMEE